MNNNSGGAIQLHDSLMGIMTPIQDIDSSNLVDGKPTYYWINNTNKAVPTDAGYVLLINCSANHHQRPAHRQGRKIQLLQHLSCRHHKLCNLRQHNHHGERNQNQEAKSTAQTSPSLEITLPRACGLAGTQPLLLTPSSARA